MKKVFKLFIILLSLSTFISCEDVNVEPQIDYVVSEDNALATNIVLDVFSVVSNGASTDIKKSINEGPIITIIPNSDGTYNMVVDYGNDGYLEKGISKTGVVNADFSGFWTEGATVTITFDGFAVDESVVEGSIVVLYKSGGNMPTFELVANNMSITFPDDKTISWEVPKKNTLTFNQGSTTPLNKTDDIWTLYGESNGKSRSGKSFTSEVIDLVVNNTTECKWFESGTINLALDGEALYEMTFGETCGLVTFQYRGKTITRIFD